MLKKDRAVCLRKTDYSETSQVVTLFTRSYGKVPAMAKGAKRTKSPFDGPIEIFSFGDIVFSPPASQKLATLTQFEQKPVFIGLTSRLYNLNCAFFAAELLDKFTHDHDPHPELFDSFTQFLTDIQHIKNGFEALGLFIIFQLTLLSEVGTKPILSACTGCKTPFDESWPHAYFTSQAGGIVCRDCEQAFTEKTKLSKRAAVCLNDLKRILQADKKTLNEIERILVYHFTELLGKPPKMAKHFIA